MNHNAANSTATTEVDGQGYKVSMSTATTSAMEEPTTSSSRYLPPLDEPSSDLGVPVSHPLELITIMAERV